MSESCLIVRPSSRTVVMGQETNIGIKSTVAVDSVETQATIDTPSSNTAQHEQNSGAHDSQLVDLTGKDDNAHTETTKISNGTERTSHTEEEQSTIENQREHSDKSSSEETPAGKSLYSSRDTQDSSGPSVTRELVVAQHERIEPAQPLDISYLSTPASIRLRQVLVSRLETVSHSGRIQVIDLSYRGLTAKDADLIRTTLKNNPQLAILKLGYNNLGDDGATIISSSCSTDGRHHRNLKVLDLGFNSIGDTGCEELAMKMLAGNHTLRKLYLSGNIIKDKGAISLSRAVIHGCSLSHLHLSANYIGPKGTEALAGAVAQMDLRRQSLLQRHGGIVIAAVKPQAIEVLLLGDTSMGTHGIVSISGMLVTNQSLRYLELSNNNIDDRDMALLSQALAQNKSIPLLSIQLSFNKITCVGIEGFMNAIWGSKTLKEIKLDNNKMQDRGAQLCSVVLGSIELEHLDLSFNRISTVGIKAVMKSLSENGSLRALSLSGIPIDQNASKAVSYALAYNQSLMKLHLDSCCVGYSGQRHIVAGIVSNTNVKLRDVTGFQLSAITKTLGLPQIPDDWGNDRVLSFIRFMWSHSKANQMHHSGRGPAAPAIVADAGREAFSALSSSDSSKLDFQKEHSTSLGDDSPVTNHEASILVRSDSGKNLQIPMWNDGYGEDDSWLSDADSFDRSSFSGSSSSLHRTTSSILDPHRRDRNLQWARVHFQALNEIGNLVFNNADLWQLHQYYFSPAYATSYFGIGSGQSSSETQMLEPRENLEGPKPASNRDDSTKTRSNSESLPNGQVTASMSSRPNKRSSHSEKPNQIEPSAKRAKSSKPRIAFFPRIREKLESLGAKPSAQTLSLLRQLKYVESVMLKGRNIYEENSSPKDEKEPDAEDVEMILLDLF